MISNKKTLERVENLERVLITTLQSFQIARYSTIPELGVVDLPIFGLRFKIYNDGPREHDDKYQIIHIPTEEFIVDDKLFIILCTKGYIHWLRDKLGTHAFMAVLSQKDRWISLVEAAIEKSREEKKGEYLTRYFESFLERPFLDIYHEDPSVFDWMVT